MTFWIITAAMAAIVAMVLGRAVSRGARDLMPAQADFDLRVYRDQLAEIERDVARGVVSQQDAARVRTEVSRRILLADTAQAQGPVAGSGPSRGVQIVVALLLIAGSLGGYYWLGQPGYGDMALADRIAFAEEVRRDRPDQQSAEAGLPAGDVTDGMSPQYLDLLTKLRAAVAARPGDLQGHVLLAQNEAKVGNFSAAARAQEEVLRLKGGDTTAEDIADYAELLVMAAGGYVSPDAEVGLRAVLAQDAENGRARYYLGLMMAQTGRPDIAFRLWDGLLRRGPPDAAWIAPIAAQIMPLAELAGVEYEMPEIGNPETRGPSAADIENASGMTVEDRMEMIGGMVAGLSDRLATEGGPPADWARLITSLGVLGDTDQARAIYGNALDVFAGDAGALDMIRAAGDRAGVAE